MTKKRREKTLAKEERREIRLEKAEKWLFKDKYIWKNHLLSRYCRRMNVPLETGRRDLHDLGVILPDEDPDAAEKNRRRFEFEVEYREYIRTSNDDFAYIEDYTSGGFAYGVTWDQVGIDPSLPYDEKVRLYAHQDDAQFISDSVPQWFIENEDLPF